MFLQKRKSTKGQGPFRRVLESEHINDIIKKNLRLKYESVKPVKIKKKTTGLKEVLLRLNLRQKVRKEAVINAGGTGISRGCNIYYTICICEKIILRKKFGDFEDKGSLFCM